MINYILGTLQPDTDLAMVGYPFTDEVSHQFLGLVTPNDPDGSPNPCYDVNAEVRRRPVHRARHGGPRRDSRGLHPRAPTRTPTRSSASRVTLMGGNPTTFAGSDHGFGAGVLRSQREQGAHSTRRSNGVSLHACNANASNCGAATTDLAKACWAGGTIQIYVNTTLPAGVTNAAVRAAATGAFQNLTDPANPGEQVIMKILQKEELRERRRLRLAAPEPQR